MGRWGGAIALTTALFVWRATAAESPRLRIVARHALPEAEDVVALAFAAGERLVMLGSSALTVYRVEGSSLRRTARAELPPPLQAVRHAAGLLLGRPDDAALWVVSNRQPGARLVEVADLATRSAAEAAPGGLRFDLGTNRLRGGDDRALAAVASGQEAVVSEAGELIFRGAATGLQAGDAVAALGDVGFVVSAPDADPEQDALWVVERVARRARVLQRLPLKRRVLALAAREDKVAAALDASPGIEVVLLERARP